MAQRSKARAEQSARFSKAEKRFLERNELCKVATSHNDMPHVTPVNFIFNGGAFYFATDYGSRKYRNLEKNKNVGLVVDIYESPMDNKAVVVQGTAEIIEKGSEFKKLYGAFYKKFEWVRQDPWEEEEAPFIKVRPLHKASWGLK
jgi:nitroimidazol reductase NimA-like FMN-containing flavoprotein (pyridoxamine 5'-phosphate oxidase superfamily)